MGHQETIGIGSSIQKTGSTPSRNSKYRSLATGTPLPAGRLSKVCITHYLVTTNDIQYTIIQINIRAINTEVGGGSKQKFRWVDNLRIPKDWPEDKELVEKVIGVYYDPIRTSCLAMTGYGDKLRWQIATGNMKVGDLIRSTTEIPEMTVKPLEGNSHPLGNEKFSL